VKTIAWTLLFLALAAVPGAGQEPPKAAGNWPQWRGPNRDNLSADRNLLKSWPEGGPPLFWDVHGLGIGIAAVAVSGGRVFTVGYLGDAEYLTALDEVTGKRLWAAKIGPVVQEQPLMRWLGQRTPTVDGDRVYATNNEGLLVCYQSATGKELWRKDYTKDFGARKAGWGFCERPLIDGDKLILAPGGTVASVAALQKVTGAILWKSDVKGGPAHAATVISEAAGVRQYVSFLYGKIVGVRASDGKHLWTHDNFGVTACTSTPIPWGDKIIGMSGYSVGMVLLKLSALDDGVPMRVEYTTRLDINPLQDSGLVVGNHLYVLGNNGRKCVDLADGKELWRDNTSGRGLAAMTHADGHLYLHFGDGTVALAEATPEKFVGKSSFKLSGWQSYSGASNPVVTGGRLYIRNETRLLCFDVRETALSVERKRPAAIVLDPPNPGAVAPPVQAIYVPTPQDVVEKMLQVGSVGEDQDFVDLGSGDGRFVITAARKHKASAVGYEIDEQLVKESRAAIEKAGLGTLASIQQKDLFQADLANAAVVAAYLPEKFLERLIPQFDKMGCGSRIVTHQFAIPGMVPDATHRMESKDDGDTHTIYVYTTPLRRKKE